MLHAAREFRGMLAMMKGEDTRATDTAQSPPTMRQTGKAGQYPWWDRDAPQGPRKDEKEVKPDERDHHAGG